MKYIDNVYGETEISEPVILELIGSPTFRRLKGISQFGYIADRSLWGAHSRFDHSLGVSLLLKKYGASLEEQIAGLIHDVSHGVFSHCIDYVLAEGFEKEQKHQDSILNDFVMRSEIPVILEKYGINEEFILDDKNFPLKEKDLPDLCADRIDYSLRDAIECGEIRGKESQNFLDKLLINDNAWIFGDFSIAKHYCELFSKMNSKYYCGLSTALMFGTVGNYLKRALDKGYILKDDLYTTEEKVLAKIALFIEKDKQLGLFFDRMNRKVDISEDKDDYDMHIFCKSRAVDPLFRDGSKIKRVSEVDEQWRTMLEKELAPKEYFIKFNN